MNCPKCNAEIADGHRFCTECGYRIVEETPAPEPVHQDAAEPQEQVNAPAAEAAPTVMDNVENHIMWNVQPGQVARLIPEKEFSQYSDAAGLIVNEGARVLVRTNADDLTMLSSGIYSFPEKADVQRTDGRGFINNIFRSAGSSENVAEGQEQLKTCSILLVRDGDFPVIFGGAASTPEEFVPMTVPTRNLDVNVGVSAMLRISSMQLFAARYMLDRTSMTTAELVRLLAPKVEKVLRDVLADVEVSESGLTDIVKSEISERLVALTAELGGVGISSVEEIRVGSEELERFRALNSELYLTGRELEYLERTNEFKNRLTAAQNAQQINEARSELALLRSLQEVNKDKLLAEDELEQFYTVLSREKRIREAQSEAQIAEALADIERTGLIRSEDLNALKDDIRLNEHKRGHVFRMMQKKDELELASLTREYEKRVRDEDYEFEKRKKDDEFDRFKELQRIKEEKDAAEHKRNMEALEAMQRAKLEKYRMSRDLTPEQLMAIAANENLSPEAAAKLAESLGKGREVEAERARQEEINRLNQARVDDMKELLRMNHGYSPQGQPAQPYGYPQQQPQQPAGRKFCPQCGTPLSGEARFCMTCGTPLN